MAHSKRTGSSRGGGASAATNAKRICPVCGKQVAAHKSNGTLKRHKDRWGYKCNGGRI